MGSINVLNFWTPRILNITKTRPFIIQYTAISHGGKNDNFQMKKVDNFLIFAQSIDCRYTLELPQ